jgi:protein gp37
MALCCSRSRMSGRGISMAKTTIEWTATVLPDGTSLPGFSFNPWVGCTKISPACDHCYAEGWAKRTGSPELWQGERRRTTESYWRQPLKWNREAAAAGVRRKVFCASLADVFDNQVPADWRADLWAYIAETPNLDWLLLTKRPQNIAEMLPVMDSTKPGYKPWNERWPWHNVWLGTTVENQEEADRRIPHLLSVPARVHFLSCEPLLGAIKLNEVGFGNGYVLDALRGESWAWRAEGVRHDLRRGQRRISWVIAGGESGPGARPAHPAWFRGLRDQCIAAGVPYFFKQHGTWVTEDQSPPDAVLPGSSTMFWAQLNREGQLKRGTDETAMYRLGKKAAGALLDGREWREVPNG